MDLLIDGTATLDEVTTESPAVPLALADIDDFGPNPGQLRMVLGVPSPTRQASPRPLVVALHGCTQTAAGYARGAGWASLAVAHDFILLLPEQRAASNNRQTCFSWFEPGDTRRGAGEVESIRAMIATAIADHGADPKRVYITGLSAGGAMAGVMLAVHPELFAAGTIIAGLPYGADVERRGGLRGHVYRQDQGRPDLGRRRPHRLASRRYDTMAPRHHLARDGGHGGPADQCRRTRQAMDQCPRPGRGGSRRGPSRQRDTAHVVR